MTEGWTAFDYALAAWCVTGFVTFTIAGLFQMARIDKSMTEAIRKVSNKKESIFQAFAPGRIGVEIDPSASGIAAGTGFAMVASAMGVALARLYLESGEAGGLFGALFCLFAATWALFYLCRAVWARLRDRV